MRTDPRLLQVRSAVCQVRVARFGLASTGLHVISSKDIRACCLSVLGRRHSGGLGVFVQRLECGITYILEVCREGNKWRRVPNRSYDQRLRHWSRSCSRLQIIVCVDGVAEIDFEHTGADGYIVMSFVFRQAPPRRLGRFNLSVAFTKAGGFLVL